MTLMWMMGCFILHIYMTKGGKMNYYKKKVEITDEWWSANDPGTFWVEPFMGNLETHSKGQFLACGIVFNRAVGGGNYAEIEAILHDENETDWAIYRLEVGRTHELAVKGIRTQHTSAREIKILAE